MCEVLAWLMIGSFLGFLIGRNRGQPIGGALLGALLGPIGWLIALLSSDKSRAPCPACKELIKADATVCPFCRSAVQG